MPLLSESFSGFCSAKGWKQNNLEDKKEIAARLQLWMRLGGSFTSLKQHVSKSLWIRFLYSESESSQLTQLKSKPSGYSARSLFCTEKIEHFYWDFFSQNNCFIFNWMLGCRRSGNQHSFSDTKTIKHVMWPFYVSKNCLWDLIHLSVCLPTFLCHQPQLLNDWNAVKQSSIYNHFIR